MPRPGSPAASPAFRSQAERGGGRVQLRRGGRADVPAERGGRGTGGAKSHHPAAGHLHGNARAISPHIAPCRTRTTSSSSTRRSSLPRATPSRARKATTGVTREGLYSGGFCSQRHEIGCGGVSSFACRARVQAAERARGAAGQVGRDAGDLHVLRSHDAERCAEIVCAEGCNPG